MLFLLPAFAISQNNTGSKFIINGNVNYLTGAYIYFVSYTAKEERLIDSAKVINGKFTYTGFCNGYLERFFVKLNYKNKLINDTSNSVQIPIDNSVMTLQLKLGAFSKYILHGCKACDEYALLNKQLGNFKIKSDRYEDIIEDTLTSPEKKKKFEALSELNDTNLQKFKIKWLKKNPSNNLTALNILRWKDDFADTVLINVYQNLGAAQKESEYGIRLKKRIEYNFAVSSQVGKAAADFTSLSYDSTVIHLKEFNNKNYVLLDFWASWCAPCRASHPELIKLFEKYRSQNFKIIGIADDNDKLKWKNAIQSDSVFIWQHILRGFNRSISNNKNDLNKLYFVEFLPTKILIDDTGKIIGQYVGGNLDELNKKLYEIYKY